MSSVRATATAKRLVSLSHINLTRYWPDYVWGGILKRLHIFRFMCLWQHCIYVPLILFALCFDFDIFSSSWLCSLFIPVSLQLTAHICAAHLSRNASAWDYSNMSVYISCILFKKSMHSQMKEMCVYEEACTKRNDALYSQTKVQRI